LSHQKTVFCVTAAIALCKFSFAQPLGFAQAILFADITKAMKTKSRKRRETAGSAPQPIQAEVVDERWTETPALSPNVRVLVTIALIVHLVAVAIPPMSVPPASTLQSSAASFVRPYTEFVGLANHGYRFFAPDPGPSDMMRVKIWDKNGRQQPDIDYPDLNKQWPRLLYHRHFMLTSRLQGAPDNLLGRQLAESYARHLCAKHDAREVRIYRRLHRLASPEQVLQRVSLRDESLFETPYEAPWDEWKVVDPRPTHKTEFTLHVQDGGRAIFKGQVLGKPMPEAWAWAYVTLQRLEFAEPGGGRFTTEYVRPHEVLVRFPLGEGQELTTVAHREPPPLAVYRGDAP
jgi:hypothetical protein